MSLREELGLLHLLVDAKTMPVGTISTWKDGSKRIKTAAGKWIPYRGSGSKPKLPAKSTKVAKPAKPKTVKKRSVAAKSTRKSKQPPDPAPAPAAPAKVNASPMSEDEFDAYKRDFIPKLSSNEFASAMMYSGKNHYTEINTNLRTGKENTGDHAKAQTGLDSQIDKAVLEKDTLLYRGASGKDAWGHYGTFKEGDVYQDLGYTSTSGDENSKVRNEDVVIHISAPAGSKGAPIPSQYSSEREILLPRGSKFRVDKRELLDTETYPGSKERQQRLYLHVTVTA